MTHLLEDLHDFLSNAPTSWHAVVEMGNRLATLDYTPLFLDEKWELEKGGKYFVVQDGSLATFVLPEKKPKKMPLITAHTDSPALKLKPHPVIEKENFFLLGAEIYGGPILATWMNRDLAIAGRVVVETGNDKAQEFLVFFEDSPVIIPLLAPHLDREAYKDGLKLDKQEHLISVAGLRNENLNQDYLEGLLKRSINYKKLLDFDLFLVPIEPPRFIGKDGEMLASYRIDNLVSAHAGIVAFGNIEKASKETLPIGLFWDHEEIGSSTHVGAGSPFFKDIFSRISEFYKISDEEESILRRTALCASVDMCQAYNPNFEKKYDPNHKPLLGKGVAIKYNANMRYVSDAKTASSIIQLCDKLHLPYQKFVNRTDNAAGSTVGPIFATALGIPTVDIGIPQLSMHAAREIMSCQDHLDLCNLLTHFLVE